MIYELLFALTVCAALGCGLIGGVFFAFSAFVMRALGRLPPAQGITAMQSINVAVINPWFLALFLGTAAACATLAVSPFLLFRSPGHHPLTGSVYLPVGGVLYLVGTVLVTRACNVPLNEALAAIDPGSADGASHWPRYVARWTAWNHVRAVASLAAAAALMMALRCNG